MISNNYTNPTRERFLARQRANERATIERHIDKVAALVMKDRTPRDGRVIVLYDADITTTQDEFLQAS